MVSMSELKDLIRSVAGEHPTADYAELARHVAKLTPDDSVVGFYEEALRPFISEVIRADRNNAVHDALSETPEKAQPEQRRSPNVAGVASAWAKMLEETIPLDGIRKRLGDCTTEDLDFAIERRAAQIEADKAKMAEYVTLRDWMAKHGAKTLRDAPPM